MVFTEEKIYPLALPGHDGADSGTGMYAADILSSFNLGNGSFDDNSPNGIGE